MPWRKKDEVGKRRKADRKVPYKKCGHKRSYKAPNGSTVTVICIKNGNLPHVHD